MRTFSTSSAPTTSLSPSDAQRSPWHSPVPYLFGGLAAMLGLIAFALLILACSYWKLSGRSDNGEGGERDLESGKEGDSAKQESVKVYEEKILVIMAGDEKPTFLATPVATKFSSFGHENGRTGDEEAENTEKTEKEMETREEALTARGNEETQQQNQ